MGIRTLQIKAEAKNIGLLEDFIRQCFCRSQKVQAAALIIAAEVFDNICEHAVLVENTQVTVLCSHIFRDILEFRYWSTNFTDLLAALKGREPYFDARTKRYRGFGLRMAANLSRKIYYRTFFGMSRIIIYL
ncbi:MAG: hypothetical protein ACTTH7_07735 [Treponema sp.]